MLLKRTAIITLSTLFLTVGCISISTDDEVQKVETTLQAQETKITNLEAALIESKAEADKKQNELTETKMSLEQAQQEKQKLDEELQQKILVERSRVQSSKQVVKEPVKADYLDKTVLGQAEWIYVTKAKENFKARIDTGATTSSINAVKIQAFERDGKEWVKFNITHDKDGKEKFIEAPVLRYVKILQSSEPGEFDRRPVVELHVRIGGVAHKSEFTLTDRQHMDFPVLIGRSFIQDVILVDVSQDYIHPKYQPQDK
ncbi:MAG: RimK/LysX family protein [Psychromonas sp.]